MEPENTEKGKRRKLKRIVQKKKPKISLNSSASAAYYKKVKAALNASLNSSRTSQTLKANNKALAQSLQHVKQELRHALNENGRLKVENQDLTMRLLRLENQAGCGQEQTTYQQKLQGLKVVLNDMSRHLLELGTCVNDGMDLCLITTRQSQSSASRPQSLEKFKVTEAVQEQAHIHLPDAVDEPAMDCEPGHSTEEEEGEMYSVSDGYNNVPKAGMATPDMSIIMEQSVLDHEEGFTSFDTSMEPVSEESIFYSRKSSKRMPTLSKLPRRIRTEGSINSSSNDEDSSYQESVPESTAFKITPGLGAHRAESKNSEDSTKSGKGLIFKSPRPRRQTFVVNKNDMLARKDVEHHSLDSVEGITGETMPDLVSGSPVKDKQKHEVSEPIDNVKNVKHSPDSPVKTKSKKKTAAVSKGPSTALSKEREKSVRKKTQLSSVKNTKTPAAKSVAVTSASQKDDEFFISNPCALNLVHERLTGSSEGCMDSETDDNSASLLSVDSFLARIKESNRKSSKVASFFAADDSANPKSETLVERRQNVQTSAGSPVRSEFDKPDHTMYFDTDMEFTEVLSQPPNSEPVEDQENSGAKSATGKTVETKQRKGKRKDETDKTGSSKQPSTRSKQSIELVKSQDADKTGSSNQLSTRSKQNIESVKSQDAAEENEEDSEKTDRKLPFALRVNKPGQMVFAVSRKDEDGSRKAIPAKLQTHARSKSKKQMEEMVKNLPQKEAECIFDFHDKTPQQKVTDAKANKQDSVFDLSLNDTESGMPSFAALHEKLKVLSKDSQQLVAGTDKNGKVEKRVKSKVAGNSRPVVPSLLGDAPVYTLPLKDDDNDDTCNQPEARPRSRSRSASRGRDSQRQGRSKSRSRKVDKEERFENVNPSPGSSRRSRSRGRSGAEAADSESNENDVSESRKSTGRQRGRNSEYAEMLENEDGCEKPRRSARSKSRVQKIYSEDNNSDSENSFIMVSEEEKKHVRSRSRSKLKREDEDDREYKPRGRSRPRQLKHEDDRENNPRSRSRPIQLKDQDKDDREYNPRCRSRPRQLKDQDEDDREYNPRSRSRPRQLKDQDEDDREYNPRSRSQPRQLKDQDEDDREYNPRSRSRPRQISNSNDKEEKPSQRRGRSRSRRRVEEDGSCRISTQESDHPNSEYFETSARVHSQTSGKVKNDKEESSTLKSESTEEPLKLITERRQRSKSSSRRLYSEVDLFSDSLSITDVEKNEDAQSTSVPEKKSRAHTRSKSAGLRHHEWSSDTVSDSDNHTVSSQKLSSHKLVALEAEKRKSSRPDPDQSSESQSAEEFEYENYPNKKMCTERNKKHMANPEKGRLSAEKQAETAKTGHTRRDKDTALVTTTPTSKRVRKSGRSLAVSPAGDEEQKTHHCPSYGKITSKMASKVPEQTAAEKHKYLLQFEEVKRKLKELDTANSSLDPDLQYQLMKPRPLVLPQSLNSTAASQKKAHARPEPSTSDERPKSKAFALGKKEKSWPNSPKAEKETRSQAGSPLPRPAESAVVSAASTPQISDGRISLETAENPEFDSQSDGRRGRRAAASVCYKEPSLNAKLRRGDPHTTFLHKEDMVHIYKSPKGQRKNGKSGRIDRGALHDLTNLSIMESEAE